MLSNCKEAVCGLCVILYIYRVPGRGLARGRDGDNDNRSTKKKRPRFVVVESMHVSSTFLLTLRLLTSYSFLSPSLLVFSFSFSTFR